MNTTTNHGAVVPLPGKPPRPKSAYELEDERRTWRMANNRDAYPPFASRREGFAGIVGEITDRFCKECEQNIQLRHMKGCTVGAAEEGACP
jgi:hypothetical protein